jgi:hypothetical protein
MHRSKGVSFDHLVGVGGRCGRYFEVKRLCRFEIDHQFEATDDPMPSTIR